MTATLIVTSLFVCGSTSLAQNPAQPPPAQEQPQPAVPGQRPLGPGGMGTMSPDMMQMMGRMSGRMETDRRDQRLGGPLQRVSSLLAALDDPRVRTTLGLRDQQADGLRKIIIDTETFTIQTGAEIAVNTIELRELLRADKPDKTAVKNKGDQISKSTSLLISHYLDAMLAAKAILTPEQQKMIRAYLERGAPALTVSPARP